jgi:hypothetical protein
MSDRKYLKGIIDDVQMLIRASNSPEEMKSKDMQDIVTKLDLLAEMTEGGEIRSISWLIYYILCLDKIKIQTPEEH